MQLFISYLDAKQLESSSFKAYVTRELEKKDVHVLRPSQANKAAVQRGNEAYIRRRRAELAAALREVAREGGLPFDEPATQVNA